MTKSLKMSLLMTAGFAAVAIPVLAGQNMTQLRGAFPNSYGATNQAYVYADPNACGNCEPSWHSQTLRQMVEYQQPQDSHYHQSQSRHQPQPVQSDCGTYTYSGQGCGMAGANYAQTYAPAPTYVATNTNDFGLRGFSNPGGVQYSKSAANAFNNSRHFNVGGVSVRTSASHTERMLDWQENQTGKALTLLANRANGVLQDNSIYLGGGVQGGFMYQRTDTAGAFPILSRFPDFSASTDREAGVFAINNAALSFTSTFGDWTTLYLQPEYSETEYGREQEEFQLRKAYVVFGNLEKTPFYAAFGRKNIDFGNFDSYNAFTHSEGAHYFLAHSDQPVLELGFYKDGFKLVGSAFSGGRQLRVAYAGEENNIANYAFNAEKEFRFGHNKNKSFTLGGGYLHDTIYRNNFTAHTFAGIATGTPPANFIEYRNSAVSGFAEYNSKFLDMMVEYTTTLKPWGAAIPQDVNGIVDPAYIIDPLGSPNDLNNINFDQNLEVLVAQARIKPMVKGKPLTIAATGSWGNIADDFVGTGIGGQPTTWKNNQQHALSLEYPISPYLEVGAEYVYNKGFIPFVAPQLISNDAVNAHAINVGFKARF
ncbi:MAG: hypothetical protein ACSHXY_11470 [Alphaproteobacteria bacterium]